MHNTTSRPASVDPSRVLSDEGGIAHVSVLRGRGVSWPALTALIRGGAARRVAHGWYSNLPDDDARVRAVALGGRVTGASALHLVGAWSWRPPPLEVVIPRSRGRPAKIPSGLTLSRHALTPGSWRKPAAVVSLDDALVRALPRVRFEAAVALLDWALKTGHLDDFGIFEVAARLPQRCRGIAEWVDPRCDSFLESVARTRLRLDGQLVTSQVPVGFLQSIDLVVNGVVGIELDGREFHEGTFEADRRKDLAIVAEGRSVLRLSYSMVRDEWPAVAEAVEAALMAHRGFTRRVVGPRVAARKAMAERRPWALPRPRREVARAVLAR